MRALVSSVVAVVVFTAVLGFGYPALMTGFAAVAFPDKAKGSLIEADGKVVGSRLAAQEFTDPQYFHSRPSATAPALQRRRDHLRQPRPDKPRAREDRQAACARHPRAREAVQPGPHDRGHSGGRGHDLGLRHRPAHLAGVRAAPGRARRRCARTAARTVERLIDENTDGRGLGFFGEPGVNVLELNIALDKEKAS